MLTRREFTRAGASLLLGAGALSAAARGSAKQKGGSSVNSGTLQVFSFENAVAIKPLLAAMNLFHKQHPHVTVDAQVTDYNDFVPKLSTLVAGGNAPDVFSSNLTLLPEYAKLHAIKDLSSLVHGGTIDLTDYPKPVVQANEVGGKLYGVPFDLTAPVLLYNATLFDRVSEPAPPSPWTWEQFQTVATKLSKSLGNGVWGSEDFSANSWDGLEFWLRPKGKTWLTSKGKLGFNQSDLSDWLQFWQEMRSAGAVPPAAVTAQVVNDTTASLFATSKAAMMQTLTPQFLNIKSVNQNSVGLRSIPSGFTGAKNLQTHSYAFAGYSMSISAATSHPQLSGQLIQFLLSNKQAIKTYLDVSGRVPASAKDRAALAKVWQGNTDQTNLLQYIDGVAAHAGPAVPQGPTALGQLFTRTAQAVAFGHQSISAAVSSFFDQAPSTLQGA